MRFERTLAVTVLATGLIFGGLVAAASPEDQPKPTAPAPPPPPPPPSDSNEEKLPPKTMTKAGHVPWRQAEVKPEHAILSKFVGKFTTKVHVYSGPYIRKYDTEGAAEGRLLMGGLFVELTHTSERQKQTVDSMTIYGFDKAVRRYTADAIDNTSGALVHYLGTYDAAKNQLVLTAHFNDQDSRKLTIVRTVTTFVDSDTWTYEEFVSHKKGETETPVVSITYKRV